MADILIVYATGEGQTGKVADRLMAFLREQDHAVELVNVDFLPEDLDLGRFDGVLVGASIHMGRHQKQIKSFIRSHLEDLTTLPSGFFQVSLSAAIDDETHRAEALGYVDELIEETGWQPDRFAIFGGALRYSEYGFLTRSLLKSIAKRETGDVDTSRDYEYTDWDEVEQFATEIGAFIEDETALRSTLEPEPVD